MATQTSSNPNDFPNSWQINGKIWIGRKQRFRKVLGAAPRKHWAYTTLQNGVLALTPEQTLTLSARGLATHERKLSETAGFTQEALTVKQQLLSIALDILITGAAIGLLISIVGFLQRPDGAEASVMGFVNLFALGFGLGLLPGIFWALLTLPRVRAFHLIALKFQDGRQWDFGVPASQAQETVAALESQGLTGETV